MELDFKKLLAKISIIFTICVFWNASYAQIRVGVSACLTGPISGNCKSYLDGAQIYLNEINNLGGVRGKKVLLDVKDDQYSSDIAVKNMEAFVSDSDIHLVFAAMGAPAAMMVDKATQSKLAIIGGVTGAIQLQNPSTTLFHTRASYKAEIRKIVDHLGLMQYANAIVLANQDPFGDALLAELETTTQTINKVGIQTYRINSAGKDIDLTTTKLDKTAKVPIVLISGGKVAIDVISALRKAGFTNTVYALSVANPVSIVDSLGSLATDIVVAQVVPSPNGSSRAAQAFRASIKKASSQQSVNALQFEGYLAARVLVELLKSAPAPLNRASFLQHTKKSRINVDGLTYDYTQSTNGSKFVELLLITKDGRFVR